MANPDDRNGAWALYLIWALTAAILYICFTSAFVLEFGYTNVPILFNNILPFAAVATYYVTISVLPKLLHTRGCYMGSRTRLVAQFKDVPPGTEASVKLSNGTAIVVTSRGATTVEKVLPPGSAELRIVASSDALGVFSLATDDKPLIAPRVFRVIDATWNFFLALLSLVMLLGTVLDIGIRLYKSRSINLYTFFCDEAGWANDQPANRPGVSVHDLKFGENELSNLHPGPLPFFAFVFAASKYVELFDTVLMIVKRPRRNVIFLHWYHHCTVLLFTWYTAAWGTTAGIFFVVVNATVHSFMYYFYFRGALGGRISWSKSLTMLQMTQMVAGIGIGLIVSYKWYVHHYVDSSQRMCRTKQPETMISCCILMYSSYLWLFFDMYAAKYYKTSGLGLLFGRGGGSSSGADVEKKKKKKKKTAKKNE